MLRSGPCFDLLHFVMFQFARISCLGSLRLLMFLLAAIHDVPFLLMFRLAPIYDVPVRFIFMSFPSAAIIDAPSLQFMMFRFGACLLSL